MANNEVKITLKAIDEATHTIVRFSAESAKSLNNLNTTLKDMQRQSALAFRATQQHIDDTEKKIRGSSPGILSGLGSWIVGFVSTPAVASMRSFFKALAEIPACLLKTSKDFITPSSAAPFSSAFIAAVIETNPTIQLPSPDKIPGEDPRIFFSV